MRTTSIDDIYEAAFVPERWPDVLDSLGTVSNSASSAILIFGDRMPPRGIASHSLAPTFDTFLRSGDWPASIRTRRMLSVKPSSFVLVDAYVSAEESDRDPVWSLLKSQGRSSQLCTMIPAPGGETITFTAERATGSGAYRPGEIAALNALRPHLARAGTVSARLALDHVAGTVTTIERLGLAAAALTATGRVSATNRLFDDLSPMIVPSAFGKILIDDVRQNQVFQDALDRLRLVGTSDVQSIPIAATRDSCARVVHLLPLRGAAHDIFGESEALMIVTAAIAAPAPSAALLTGLFDLSPAEARLVRHLARGTIVSEVAAATGVSVATLRTQLSAIFAKTRTTRQAELLNLVAGIWTPPGDPETRARAD